MRTIVCVLFALPLFAADPEKPLTLKPDELAVLADKSSPDHQTVLDRYDGKLLKIEARACYLQGMFTSKHLLRLPKKSPTDPSYSLSDVAWTKDPAMEKTIKQIEQKSQEDAARRAEKKPVDNPGVLLTVYARLSNGKLIDVATDPKIAGIPYKPKAKEPAKLKD